MAEGGKDVFADYEDTEMSNETDGETDVSLEDLKFLRAVKMLGISTKVSTIEDLAYLQATFEVKQEPEIRTEDPVAARHRRQNAEEPVAARPKDKLLFRCIIYKNNRRMCFCTFTL